jgi:sucrose-6F-phosphate phosphohydrolase
MKRRLLCVDLDRTLIPNGIQAESKQALALFRQFAAHEALALVYVTGRHRSLIEQGIAEYGLPQPDFVIADVGTTIYRITATGWHRWHAWSALIGQDWPRADIDRLLSVFTALKRQEADKQGRHKLSYYVEPGVGGQELMDDIATHLYQAGMKSSLIWSIDEHASIGLLDVLPASASKLHAIRFLMQQANYDTEHTLFAGDSGNDLDVLLSDIPSVLVANAEDDVRTAVGQVHEDVLYVARGGYLEMNGNYAAGILEGVAHFWPEADTWLRAR